jgi:hypothetical protein
LQDARFLRCSSMIKLSVQCQSERTYQRERENKSVQKRTVTLFTIWFSKVCKFKDATVRADAQVNLMIFV